MNIPCLLSMICLFVPQTIKYNSKCGMVVALNGIMYYLNPHSKILRMNDIFWNMIFGLYLMMIYKNSRMLIIISGIIWLINYLTKDNDYIHVLGVQLPSSIALYKYIKN